MPGPVYRVAIISRGAGAFTYSYSGPEGLGRGQLALLRFRNRLETGAVLEPDDSPPPGVELQALIPVECKPEGWGQLLLELCELACAAPHELWSRLALNGSVGGFHASLHLHESVAKEQKEHSLLECAGRLNPARRKLLAVSEIWTRAVAAATAGKARIELAFAGQPGVSSAKAALRQYYELDNMQALAAGLPAGAGQALPGGYLSGLPQPPQLSALRKLRIAPEWQPQQVVSALRWDALDWPPDWDVCRRWPAVACLPLRRTQAGLPELLHESGLPAELGQSVAGGKRVLLLVPQAWLLDALWPKLAGIAPRLLRHDAELAAGALAHLLHAVQTQPGMVVAGTEAAWRLPAYARFDRVILLDPSHPQWQPDGAPWLDPRAALLLVCAQCDSTLDLIELGLSAVDGQAARALQVHAPQQPVELSAPGSPGQAAAVDTNPLPLKLREPGVRRLVYFNRLGSSRGLSCAECGTAVACPQCSSRALRYSRDESGFRCPDCGFAERDMRCRRCGLATLAARLPGLEAVRVRPGELLAGGPDAPRPGPESRVVLGTAQLLEPAAGYWPEQVVYVDPEERDLLGDDWRSAVDMALRLAALYANPQLASVHIVSARLAGRLPAELTTEAAEQAALQEGGLRRLGGMPPYACLYRLRVLAERVAPLADARELLGQALSGQPATALLRLGRPFQRLRRCELHGLLLNPALDWSALQELRWQVHALGAGLSINPQRGPWL